MAGVLIRLVAVGHQGSPISLIRLALPGNTDRQVFGRFYDMSCRLSADQGKFTRRKREFAGRSRPSPCHVLTKHSLANAFFKTRDLGSPLCINQTKWRE